MALTLDPIFLAAIEANNGEVLIWVEVKSTPVQLLTPTKYTLTNLSLDVTIPGFFPIVHTFRLVRGLKVDGVDYTVKSPWFVPETFQYSIYQSTTTGKPTGIFGTAKSTAGDVAVETVIGNLVTSGSTITGTGYPLTAVFPTDELEWWRTLQFLPSGKIAASSNLNSVLSMMRQKYLAQGFLRYKDETSSKIIFIGPSYHYVVIDAQYTPDHSLDTADFVTETFKNSANVNKYFRWTDELGTLNFLGNSGNPGHNLGFIPSTASVFDFEQITENIGGTTDVTLAPPRLQIESGDIILVTGGLITTIAYPIEVTEVFDTKQSPSWKMVLSPINWVSNTEGGAMPSTIERVANYTPLNTSYFDGVLSKSDNNVQAAFNTIDDNVYSKDDVDSLIAGAAFDFFFDNLASSIGGYYVMGAASGAGESTISAATLATSSVIAAYATIVGEPTFDTLSAGLYDVHFHAEKTVGTKTLAINAILYERTGAGAETTILTFETSSTITAKVEVDLHGSITTDVILAAGSRLVLKLVATVTGGGTAPTAAIYQEGTTDSHLSIRTTLTAFDGRYAQLTRTFTGTAPITVDGDNAAHDLNTNKVIAIPAATASVPGHATAAQITKLDAIAAGAQVNVLEGVTGTAPVVAGAVIAKSQAISIPAATAAVNGYATATQITKLDGIATAAQVNVLEGVTGTAPIVAGAVSSKSQAISITAASGSAAGSMAAADFTKVSRIGACAFLAYNSATDLNVTGDNTAYTIIFDSTDQNIGSNYNTGDGKFTAPYTGFYVFNTNALIRDVITGTHTEIDLELVVAGTSGRTYTVARLDIASATDYVMNNTAIVHMTATDTCKVVATVFGTNKKVDIFGASTTYTRFSGVFLG